VSFLAEKILMKGNEAIGEAAVVAGCRHYFGYPITPQSELIEYMAKRLPQVDGVFLQAESELSAINMVYGAAAAGCRVMTSSSSPGISLKQEGISYIAGSQLPCVIVNMQRGGPGLGIFNRGRPIISRPPKAADTAIITILSWRPIQCRRWPTSPPKLSIWRINGVMP
jgi:2-oxoglutarate ferredoxin oxidoreductase subunit alpha